ncbi:MAG: HAMP domain-containing histidine kinase [Anaerolineaceae bacterium]|nr:HAMP domain-containing histidine kinase [Anaerolineaceae bacterium]
MESKSKYFSIRKRLPLSFALIVLLTVVILGLVLILFLNEFYDLQERNYLENNAHLIRPGISNVLLEETDGQALQIYLINLSFLIQARIRVYDSEEMVLADSGTSKNQQFVFTNLSPEGMDVHVIQEGKAERYLFKANINILSIPFQEISPGENPVQIEGMPINSQFFGYELGDSVNKAYSYSDQIILLPIEGSQSEIIGYLELSEGREFGTDIVRDVTWAWIAGGVVSIIVSIFIGILISQRMVAPLEELTEATQQMAGGNLAVRTEITTRDEFAALGRAFNLMSEKVSHSIETLQSFIADAAHEIHTPLAALILNLELFSEKSVDADDEIDLAQEQAKRIQVLVDQMLDLSQLEAAVFVPVEVDMNPIAFEVVQKFQKAAKQKGIDLKYPAKNCAMQTKGDAGQIQLVMENLLENALKFTAEDGRVMVALIEKENKKMFEVRDTGIGIPDLEQKMIFQRFFRASNTSSIKGSGLGLAMVKVILDKHDAKIEVESEEGKGTSIRVFWS